MIILNLTQHSATPEQKAQGVIDIIAGKEYVQELLTFHQIPNKIDLMERAGALASFAASIEVIGGNYDDLRPDFTVRFAMIGGAPFMMGHLERSLLCQGIIPLYAFSDRVSEEVLQEDGSVKKVNIFKHLGFVEA